MKTTQKNKKQILLLLLIIPLIIINTITAETQNEEQITLINIIPENGTITTYELGKPHLFSTTWTNNTEILKVTINHNFTETNTNEVLTSIQLEEELEYLFAKELGAGTYLWSMTAETETENITTPEHTYIIEKAEPQIQLTINNQTENITINETETITITATIETSEGTLELLINDELKNTTETLNESNNINRTIQNIKTFNETGTHIIKARYNETENYTQKEINLTITVLEKQINITI
jgi:hypothetical protein